jgi:hypothetical protein
MGRQRPFAASGSSRWPGFAAASLTRLCTPAAERQVPRYSGRPPEELANFRYRCPPTFAGQIRATATSLEPTLCLVPRTTVLAESSCSRDSARHAQPAKRCDQVQQATQIAPCQNLHLFRSRREQGRACSHRLVKLSTLPQSVQPIQVHHSRSSEFPACPHCCQHAVKRLRQRRSDRYLERGLSQRARSIAVCHQEASPRPGQSLCPAPSI